MRRAKYKNDSASEIVATDKMNVAKLKFKMSERHIISCKSHQVSNIWVYVLIHNWCNSDPVVVLRDLN